MLYVIILFTILLIITILNYYLDDKIYIAPGTVFSAAFTFSSFWLMLFVKKWNVDLHINTICVIIFGVLIFSIASKIIYMYYNRKSSNTYKKEQENYYYNISSTKLNLFLIYCIVINILTIFYTVKAVNGSFTNIGAALYKFRNLTAYQGKNVNFPQIIDIFSGIMHSASYWFIYVFLNNYINTKKVNLKMFIICLLCTLSTTFDGSRGGLINITLAIIPMIFLLLNKKNGFKSRIKLKTILIIIFFASVLLYTLKGSASLLGRIDIKDMNPIDYIAMYTGAQIKNLDSYLQEKDKVETHFGIHTFLSLYKTFGKYFNLNDVSFDIDQSFRNVNGYNLGNVYTIFFEFICDSGYPGLVIFTSIMSIFSQIIFENAKRVKFNEKEPNIIIIVYSFIFGGIVFSFFGNKFFSQTFSLGFLKYLISWYLLNWFFCRLKIKY